MKIITWNVNGVRAIMKKEFKEKLDAFNADIICLQETKAQDDQVKEALSPIEGYHVYMNSAERKGYSGTALLSKEEPLEVTYGIGVEDFDNEGRITCAEYPDFFVVCGYIPNSGSALVRLDYRAAWDEALFSYLKTLEAKKPVIACGDFNVAHRPIDLARPEANYNKSAGYTQKEIDGMDRFTQGGFFDSFRALYPDQTEAYSWWSYRGGARAKNVGWRIDYVLMSESLRAMLKEAFILPQVIGSDHCPVGIEL